MGYGDYFKMSHGLKTQTLEHPLLLLLILGAIMVSLQCP